MKKIFLFILPLALLASCVDSLIEDGYNVDKKRGTVAPPETLFTNALKNFSDALTTPNVNSNNFRLYVQQWATTTYLQEPRYDMTSRTIPQALWQSMYRDVIADLKEAKKLLEADEFIDDVLKNNQMAQLEIMEVYAWSVLVNAFGDVPYSEAFIYEKPLPKYDDAQTVYLDILSRLNTALAQINDGEAGFGDGDLLYEGDMEQWAKFGNSLKLKLAMNLADVDPTTAGTYVAEAAPNVFTSNADNARFPYVESPPNNNPLSANLNPIYSQRQDYVIASAITSEMHDLHDPRRMAYFTDVNGAFIGGDYGFENDYTKYSHFSERIIDPELEALLLDYSEVQFYLAEAVERGFIGGGAAAAEAYYVNAIKASMEYWGVEAGDPTKQKAVIVGVDEGGKNYAKDDVLTIVGGTASIATQVKVTKVDEKTAEILEVTLLTPGEYSALPVTVNDTTGLSVAGGSGTEALIHVAYNSGSSAYLALDEVKYSTPAPGGWKEKIGTQKWIALYNRGFDAWIEWKRLDYPQLLPPTGEGVSANLVVPTRLIYPINEQTLNGASRQAAASAIGGDESKTKLFWDIH